MTPPQTPTQNSPQAPHPNKPNKTPTPPTKQSPQPAPNTAYPARPQHRLPSPPPTPPTQTSPNTAYPARPQHRLPRPHPTPPTQTSPNTATPTAARPNAKRLDEAHPHRDFRGTPPRTAAHPAPAPLHPRCQRPRPPRCSSDTEHPAGVLARPSVFAAHPWHSATHPAPAPLHLQDVHDHVRRAAQARTEPSAGVFARPSVFAAHPWHSATHPATTRPHHVAFATPASAQRSPKRLASQCGAHTVPDVSIAQLSRGATYRTPAHLRHMVSATPARRGFGLHETSRRRTRGWASRRGAHATREDMRERTCWRGACGAGRRRRAAWQGATDPAPAHARHVVSATPCPTSYAALDVALRRSGGVGRMPRAAFVWSCSIERSRFHQVVSATPCCCGLLRGAGRLSVNAHTASAPRRAHSPRSHVRWAHSPRPRPRPRPPVPSPSLWSASWLLLSWRVGRGAHLERAPLRHGAYPPAVAVLAAPSSRAAAHPRHTCRRAPSTAPSVLRGAHKASRVSATWGSLNAGRSGRMLFVRHRLAEVACLRPAVFAQRRAPPAPSTRRRSHPKRYAVPACGAHCRAPRAVVPCSSDEGRTREGLTRHRALKAVLVHRWWPMPRVFGGVRYAVPFWRVVFVWR